MLQKYHAEKISYAEPVPTVSVPEVEPETVEVVPEVVEEPKSVEPEQPEEINFDQMKQIIHENTTEETIPEESYDEPKELENPADDSSESDVGKFKSEPCIIENLSKVSFEETTSVKIFLYCCTVPFLFLSLLGSYPA